MQSPSRVHKCIRGLTEFPLSVDVRYRTKVQSGKGNSESFVWISGAKLSVQARASRASTRPAQSLPPRELRRFALLIPSQRVRGES